jgi:MFS family permease
MSAVPSSPIKEPVERLSLLTLIMTSIYNLGVNVVWLSYNLFLLPLLIQNTTTEQTKATILGTLAGASIGLAVVINIIAGILSDHTRSRFGRRRPMLIWGMLLTLPFLLLPVLLRPTLPLVCLTYLGMQIFTNVSSGAFQPTLADFVPEEQRGISAGLKGLFTLTGSAIGVGATTALFAINQEMLAYLLLPALFLLTTLLNALAMRPYDKPTPYVAHLKLGSVLIDMFRIQQRSGGFFWFIFGSFLIYMGASGFQFFGIYYIESILHITNQNAVAHAIEIAGLLNLTVSMIFAVIAGILSDRMGRRNIIILSALIAALIGLCFPFAHSFVVFLLFSAFYAASNGVILSVDTALTSDLVPLEEAGKYMAYANLAIGVANGVAPPLFGLILNFQGAPTLLSFILFFLVSAILFIASSVILAIKVPNNQDRNKRASH